MTNRRIFLKKLFLVGSVCFIPKIILSKNNKQLPNVLLLGDSISIGYMPFVKKQLHGKANVYRPMKDEGAAMNCEGTTKAVQYIEEWLTVAKWDVIHFNFGLHDLKHVDPVTGENSTNPNDPQQASLKTYKKNLKSIVAKLKATNAKLVFATTTPFPDKPNGPLRRSNQPKKYNKVGLRTMKKNGIAIDDLHHFVLPRTTELQLPNNVHFTKKGYELLAKEVSNSINKFL